MKVKKYVVDSLPQAMGQIKSELGNDAMILHTKKIKTGGFLGLFGKEKIEVIAAVDTSRNNINNQAPTDQNNYAKPYSNQGNTYNNSGNTYNSAGNYQRPKPQTAPQAATLEEQRPIIKEERPSSINKNNDSISSEVSELKRMMIKMMMNQSDVSDGNQYKKEMKTIYERLIKQGVTEETASSILEEVVKQAGDNIEHIDIINEVKQAMINTFNSNGTQKVIRNDVNIVHFVGPTGVGKTTTIAKLAAEKVLKQKKRIAFITADTYRIGAVDQLRTYAEILHAPIEVVFSPQDTQRAIEKLKNYDLIFMDTAGRNYHNDMYISELNNILAKNSTSETYLVLSLTHKFEDMISILEQFKKVNIDKVLFTKYDETLTYGAILNILSMFSYQASYITHGQNVPDDIEVFNEEKIAKAILGV